MGVLETDRQEVYCRVMDVQLCVVVYMIGSECVVRCSGVGVDSASHLLMTR